MHNYGVSPEVVRLVLAIGIILSVLIYERWRLTGGAAVVAGYLAIFIERPLYIFVTVALAVGTFYLVQHVIARKMFLYGRRRLIVMVLTGMVLQLITGLATYLTLREAAWLAGFFGIGFVLPGLIAQDMERQGVRLTVLTVLGTALLTYLLFNTVLAIKASLPFVWDSFVSGSETIPYSYHTQLLIPAVILSVAASALIFEWLGVRSGGFLTAAYAALFVLQPLHILFIAALGFVVYFFVTKVVMRWLPIFGRTKFAMMVLTGLVFTWGMEVLIGGVTRNAFVPFAGFSVISPIIVALIANDSERQGLPKTYLGVAISTLVVFSAIKGIDLLILG